MTGTGPFGRKPAGKFNFAAPEPGKALYLEPSPKRVRVVLGGETIADSRNVYVLYESGHQPLYYFPPDDVRSEFLSDSDRHTRCPKKGEASYYDIRVGDRIEEAAAWYYPSVIESAPSELIGLVAFYFNRMDAWYEEDEEVFVHPRDPYHRVDVVQSDRHVRVSLNGTLLAESKRPLALFETGLPTRWYIPREDVVAELEESETITRCPYKGEAHYYSVPGEGGKDVIWYYPSPLRESGRIEGLLCFFDERVDMQLDGEAQERPESPWQHGVKSEPANASPAITRG